MGARRSLQAMSAALVAAAPEKMKAKLATDKHIDDYCRVLMQDVNDRECMGHRGAMLAYPQIMGAMGAQQLLVVNLWQRIGAQDEAHARELVQDALRGQQMDDEMLYLESLRFVHRYREERGLPRLLEPVEVNRKGT